MTVAEVKQILAKHSLYPNKLLGQNFLIDENVLAKIISAAAIRPSDTILEIGAGLGVLTFALAGKAKKVIAVEKDKKLADILQEEIRYRGIKNIELYDADILKLSEDIFARISAYRVVANIPYYLTARLIRKLLEGKNPPTDILLTVQKEVGERLAAQPPRMNLLALGAQAYGTPKILFPISKNSFRPAPEVDSAFIRIQNISRGQFEKSEVAPEKFFKLARAAFQGKRKMLINTLAKHLSLPKEKVSQYLKLAGIYDTARPEELSVDQWMKLTALTVES